VIRASFQCTYGIALGLSARYEEALAVAESLIDLARDLRIDFALPYAYYNAAVAEAGVHRWSNAHAYVDDALDTAYAGRNVFAQHLCCAAKIRIFAQEGRHTDALALTMPLQEGSLPSATAELISSRALVLASISRLAEARVLVDDVRDSSAAIEPRVLIAAVDAIIALKSRDPSAAERIAGLLETATQAGGLDLLVTAYRSAPELLGLLLRRAELSGRFATLVSRVGDADLAAAMGQPLALEDPQARLSRREREVFEHLRRGMTNRQIASSLFIAESTVKVHVHRIFDKLGVRSRAVIAAQALLEQKGYATSAISAESSEDGP
jgi:DNA-binding NarL/FixJ family response regulator